METFGYLFVSLVLSWSPYMAIDDEGMKRYYFNGFTCGNKYRCIYFNKGFKHFKNQA